LLRERLDKGILEFSCKKNNDLEEFLSTRAILYEQVSKSRTYLFIDEDALDEKISILGYFSIGLKTLMLPDNLSNNQIRKLDGYSSKINRKKINSLPVYLIGQLAKNDQYKSLISGDEILQAAISTIREYSSCLSGRLIAVDCKPVDKLHEFYKRNHFIMIGHDRISGLDQFVYFLNRLQIQGERVKEF